jgi:uncharacterized protein (TIGR02996 family)
MGDNGVFIGSGLIKYEWRWLFCRDYGRLAPARYSVEVAVTDDTFLAAVVNAPDDAVLWLAYADWLEERGDPRAAYIRSQRERAGLKVEDPRHTALLEQEEALRQQHAAVILPWQRRLVLARVKRLLARMRSHEDEWRNVYTAKRCITKRQLAAWESANGVTLPEEYRLFLLEVGDGGMMPGSYCDFVVYSLGEVEAPVTLGEPFPISKELLRERRAQSRVKRKAGNARFYPELDAYQEGIQPPGCLEVARYPSYDPLSLVVTGELRGSLWCAAGWWPEFNRRGEQLDFLSWFEDTLLCIHEEEGPPDHRSKRQTPAP